MKKYSSTLFIIIALFAGVVSYLACANPVRAESAKPEQSQPAAPVTPTQPAPATISPTDMANPKACLDKGKALYSEGK